MRPESSKNQGGEFGSPHISRMEGDLSKILTLGQDTINKRDGRAMGGGEARRRETWEDSPGSESGEFRAEYLGKVQPDFPRSPPHPTWSNVVSAGTHVPFHQSSMIAKSPSGETLPTSNRSQPPATFEYLSHRRNSLPETESRPSDISTPELLKSSSFGETGISMRNVQTSYWGNMTLSHPASISYKDATASQPLPTIQQGVEGPFTPLHSPMIFSTPNAFASREFKPRSSASSLTHSPLSLGEATDQTSPMSSPSCSPHMTPLQLPKAARSQAGGAMSPGPQMWQLSPGPNGLNSDANEFRSEQQPPSSSHHSYHPHPPQSIPEYHHQGPSNQGYGHPQPHASPYHQHRGHGEQSYQSYLMARPYSAPMSPTKHPHSSPVSSHNPHQMHPRRSGTKLNAGSSPQSQMSRSATEILKTLLRKKACLYEPETSFAISLVTWLVGRRLALAHGYFTRQQLQSGVHSCVAEKIKEGHVTRTKVNRCMQIILNSCFHYIIPRPDGSEESGEAFRNTFSGEVASDENLLRALPAPWGDLCLDLLDVDDKYSHSSYGSDDDGDHTTGSGKNTGKDGGGDSVDSGGKRAVLLCFNENIRSAADVFRCHNEFIRDVAHTANLNLSPEEWRSFFTGTKVYRKRSIGHDGSPVRYSTIVGGSAMGDMYDRMDQQGLSKFRTSWCAKRYEHDQALCSFAHVDVNRGWLRRDPFVHNYKPLMCPDIKPIKNAEDCYFNMCPRGVDCNHAHSKDEILYHHENYKRHQCRNHIALCPLRDICPYSHANSDMLSHPSPGYNRQGKRLSDHSPIHRGSNPGSKRRSSNPVGHASGFGKHPGGSPMFYIDPAPMSEFEKTLLLPGLQALFRDHSASILNAVSAKEDAPFKYGVFGYRHA